MNRSDAQALVEQLRARYVASQWPRRDGVKIAKTAVLEEPVTVGQYVIEAGTEAVLHPPKGKNVISAVVFYTEDRYITIKSDGQVSVRKITKERGAQPRQPRYY